MKSMRYAVPAGWTALVLLAAAVPFLGLNTFYLFSFTKAIILVILVASMNLAVGYTGLVSLGHTALFIVGSYGAAVVAVDHGFPPWAAVLVGTSFGAAAGTLLAVPTLRAREAYFAVVTLAFLVVTFELVDRKSVV